ncbi:hypothetical protein Ngar_c10260 [Candidatus Nitrososphaera gargensis Ga9.2]|uniref:Uncharacterized protein n=1 Tax=Nitrososphaera gargensis (strain Ga9.2) TaxID=1237085 RepID=K0IGL3_NITGG|nr:hypothetical protein Ngar_c10260 [Candidatus Nitrososphaera gargensis Ga9.2]
MHDFVFMSYYFLHKAYGRAIPPLDKSSGLLASISMILFEEQDNNSFLKHFQK